MDKKNLEIIKKEAEAIFELLEIKVELQVEENEEGAVNLSVATEDSGVLIGYHGQTLSSLQLIINLILYKKLGQWVKVLVDVEEWRKKREDSLKTMAFKVAGRVEATGEEVALSSLSASERRTVHLALAEHPRVTTESEGEGENRRLVVKPKA